MLNITQVDKITNLEVVRMIDKEPRVMNNTTSKNLQLTLNVCQEAGRIRSYISNYKRKFSVKKAGRLRTSQRQNLRKWFQYKTMWNFSTLPGKKTVEKLHKNPPRMVYQGLQELLREIPVSVQTFQEDPETVHQAADVQVQNVYSYYLVKANFLLITVHYLNSHCSP